MPFKAIAVPAHPDTLLAVTVGNAYTVILPVALFTHECTFSVKV